MILTPPRSTRTDTLFPYTTLFRSPDQAKIVTGSVIDAIEVDARAETPRRTRNFIKFAKFEANETRSVPNANKAPTIKLWASQNGAPTRKRPFRSEEHTSELQSLMRISYAVFCLKKKTKQIHNAQKTIR